MCYCLQTKPTINNTTKKTVITSTVSLVHVHTFIVVMATMVLITMLHILNCTLDLKFS